MPRRATPKPIDEYLPLLNNPDYKLRRDGVRGLRKSRNPDAIPYLVEALKDKSATVLRMAVQGVKEFGDERGIENMVALLRHPTCKIHGPAHEYLRAQGSKAVPSLIQALCHKHNEQRRISACLLGEIGDMRAFEPLLPLLDDPVAQVRLYAMIALTRLDPDQMRERLVAILEVDSTTLPSDARTQPHHIKMHAAFGLAELHDARAIEWLEKTYREGWVSPQSVIERLKQIRDPRAISVLEMIAQSDKAIVRDKAQQALTELTPVH